MKRRDFLAQTTGVVAALASGTSQAKLPCWPEQNTTDNPVCHPGNAPGWFLSMQDGTWAAPVSNSLFDVAPSTISGSHNAIIDAWTGGCVDQDHGELILAANGGHTDYGGNEVYACALKRDDPIWVRLTDPSTNIDANDTNNGPAMYPDGKPRSVHGWSHCMWAQGRVWYLGMTGQWLNGNQSTAVWSFDRGTLGNGPFPIPAAQTPWKYHGLGVENLIRPGSNADWQSSSTAYDSATGELWSSCTFTVNNPPFPFFSVNSLTGEITRYPEAMDKFSSTHLKWSVSVIVNSVWIILAPAFKKVWLLDLNNPTSGMVSRNTTGGPDGFLAGSGAVYHKASKSIISYHHTYGKKLKKLTVPDDPFSGDFVWSDIVPAGGSTPTTEHPNNRGIYSKFNIIEDMGNGQSALVAANNHKGPVYVYKLPILGV